MRDNQESQAMATEGGGESASPDRVQLGVQMGAHGEAREVVLDEEATPGEHNPGQAVPTGAAKSVAVLGCGPAGLLAAHATAVQGITPVIFSLAEKSQIHGAQYLHTSVSELTSEEPDGIIEYRRVGNQVGYAMKVYGNMFAPTSWKHFKGRFQAWNLERAYDELWKLYSPDIVTAVIEPDTVAQIAGDFDLVISTIPLPRICENTDHVFNSVPTYIVEIQTDEFPVDEHDNPVHFIEYNGNQMQPWSRKSVLFGHEFYEFGNMENIPDWMLNAGELRPGIKPTTNTCSCHPRVVKAGRFGKWKKGVLVHHAGTEAYLAVHRMLQAG